MAIVTKWTGGSDYGRYIKALICGEPGAGKTLISSTFPKPYMASAEGGLMSVADRNVPHAVITNSEDLLELKTILDLPPAERAQRLGTEVESVVIDTIDEVQRVLIRERLESEKKDKLALQDFGWLGEQMQSIIRSFRNLDMNVVFTCHLKETRDDELGRIVYKPGLQGAIGDQIAGYVDLSLALNARTVTKVVNNESKSVIQRTLRSFPDAQHPWLKDRSGKLPSDFPVNFDDDYTRLHDLIYGDRPQEAVVTTLKPKAEQPPESAPTPVASPPEGRFACQRCGIKFDNADHVELSKIRLRGEITCPDCYNEAKKAKRGAA